MLRVALLLLTTCSPVEPRQPQLLLSLARAGINRDDDADDDAGAGPSESQGDQADDVTFGRTFRELDRRGRQKDGGDRSIVSWTRDFERWQPIAGSPDAGQSFPTSIDDYDRGDRVAGDGVVDEEKVQDWISAPDILADDQDYDLQFPALKFLLSEKRVDVRKPGPHFDRMVSTPRCPCLSNLLQQHLPFFALPRADCMMILMIGSRCS